MSFVRSVVPFFLLLGLSVYASCSSNHAAATGPTPDAGADQTAPLPNPLSRTLASHVLVISVDGLHESDLATYVASRPTSTLAALTSIGLTYTEASTSMPSDSFPGTVAIVTGGSPKTTGVFYDDSYDRELAPPGPSDSGCDAHGTEVVFDESIDFDSTWLGAGGGINPNLLPRRKTDTGCVPVYPHDYVRVNTIFEVAKAAGLRTAWSDKHPAYDLVNGPSGHGVDDLYAPEIAPVAGTPATIAYDNMKVDAIINEIEGKDHTGIHPAPIPAIFGMNFQAVSVAEKSATGGYVNDAPGPELASALDATDVSLARIVDALKAQKIFDKTLLFVTAKHGQSPVDRSRVVKIPPKNLQGAINGGASAPNLVAHLTADDVALVWLTDSSNAAAVANRLNEPMVTAALKIDTVYFGETMSAWGNPTTDSRTPDLIVAPELGVIYADANAAKIAEHGGLSPDDVHVPLLVVNPGFAAQTISTSVTTAQIAPTVLVALGLDPSDLEAVRLEGTQPLPGIAQ